jgi:hypothetical protein
MCGNIGFEVNRWIPISALALAAVGCPGPAGTPRRQAERDAGAVFIAPPAASAETNPEDAGSGRALDAQPSEPAGPEPNTRVRELGIEIWLPENARSEAQPERLSLSFPQSLSVALMIAHVAAPATLDDALRSWDSRSNVGSFGQGTTAAGVFYALRSFEVRVGVPGRPGLHRIQTVSRVFALLPLDSQKHVECTGYIEHEVDSASDPNMQIARDICTSMRALK